MRLCYLLAVLSIGQGLFFSLLAQAPLKLVYFNDYPPFSYEENYEIKGILIDVLTEVFERRMGVPTTHEGLPWARAQVKVHKGQADGYCTVPTVERAAFTRISREPVVLTTQKMFVRANHPRLAEIRAISRIEELNEFALCSYTGSGWAKRTFAGLDVYWPPTLEQSIVMIARGRADLTIEVSQVMAFKIKRMGYQDQIIELPYVFDSSTFHLCIGKQSRFVDLLPEFDKQLRILRQDGTLAAISKRY